jgi:hypothetical protein
MSRLIICIRPWRARYEAELPSVARGRRAWPAASTCRGALDAWLHPELIVPAAADRRPSAGSGWRVRCGRGRWPWPPGDFLVAVASTGRDADLTVMGWIMLPLMTVAGIGATPAGLGRGLAADPAAALFGLASSCPDPSHFPSPLLLVVFGAAHDHDTADRAVARRAGDRGRLGLPFPVVIAGLAAAPGPPVHAGSAAPALGVYGLAWLIVALLRRRPVAGRHPQANRFRRLPRSGWPAADSLVSLCVLARWPTGPSTATRS